MKNRNINAIISIASVLIMIVWGTLAGTYKHAWLAVFAGGVLIACLRAYSRGKADPEKDDAGDGGTVDVTIEPKVANETGNGESEETGE